MKPPFLSASHPDDTIVERVITIPYVQDTPADGSTPGTTMTAIIRHIETATREISGSHNSDGQVSKNDVESPPKSQLKQVKRHRVHILKSPVSLYGHRDRTSFKTSRRISSPRTPSKRSHQATLKSPFDHSQCVRPLLSNPSAQHAAAPSDKDDRPTADVSGEQNETALELPLRLRSIPAQWIDLANVSLASTNIQHPRLISRPNIRSLEATIADFDWLGDPQTSHPESENDRLSTEASNISPSRQAPEQNQVTNHDSAVRLNNSGPHSKLTSYASNPRSIHRPSTKTNLHTPRPPILPPSSSSPQRHKCRHVSSPFSGDAPNPLDATAVQLSSLERTLSKCHLDLTSRLDRLERKLDLALDKLENHDQRALRDDSDLIDTARHSSVCPDKLRTATRPTPNPRSPSEDLPPSHNTASLLGGGGAKRKKGKLRDNEKVIRSNLVGLPPHVPFGGMEGWYERVKKL